MLNIAQGSKRPRRQRISGTLSIPAPVGGWNARDALGAMKETDAVTLENWFPLTTAVQQRLGYTQYATGLGASVDTLTEYVSGSTRKFFGWTSAGNVYDVSSGGAVGAAVVSGLSNGQWQYVNFGTTAGQYLYAVNGVDKPRLYDGATWTAIDGLSVPAITGVTTTNLVHVNVHKFRLWFVEKGTLNAWYMPTASIGGAATQFSLAGVASEGGYLMAMGTWTIDAGYGVDDLAVFVTSAGQIIVYRGTDPSSASTWALVGVWNIGSPIGRKCFMKYAGDLLIITQDGLFPLSGALQSSRTNPRVALTDKISFAISTAVTSYGANYGWIMSYFAKNNQLWLNIPISNSGLQQQYVMNSISRSWCSLSGMSAQSLELYNDDLYFGSSSGFVGKAWSGNTDNGASITANGLQAFNYVRSPAALKRFVAMRPVFQADNTFSASASINVDFDQGDNSTPLTFAAASLATWDGGIWDTATWSGNAIYKSWQGATSVGYCAAPRVKAQAKNANIWWNSTDVVYEMGGVI